MLLLDDFWTWDFWIAKDGDTYHLFFLKAPKSLGDPNLRHAHARVGHAVGTDLRTWEVLDDALAPGPDGTWDDLAIWTGSTLFAEGRWHMFYTGINQREGGRHQRIGVATSNDLVSWTKHPDPVLTFDPEYYEGGVEGWPEIDWRDPWVYWSPEAGRYRMLFTARAPGGEVDERGVVGLSSSANLLDWAAEEPMFAPQEFGHLEVPQLFEESGRWYLSYSVYGERHSAKRRASHAVETGTHYAVAPSESGPWTTLHPEFFCGGDGELYAGRFERDPEGKLVFLAFLQFVDGGPFVGGLSDPIPVTVEHDGRLSIARTPLLVPGTAR